MSYFHHIKSSTMKKSIVCTLFLWALALAGYAQTFSVTPKGLQCSKVPTWPLTHTKKPCDLQVTASGKASGNNGTTNTTGTKPATALPAIPLIKLWLMTEDDN
jgi:hypothetical protein